MGRDFFPSAGGLAARVMALALSGERPEHEAVSFRTWLLTGLALLVSLPSAYFGIGGLVPSGGTPAFMLPVGITVGAVITAFGALFTACHIKELSARLGLGNS
jgi:hypothetical protein